MVELAQWQERFAALGVELAAMTYEGTAQLAGFHQEHELGYPLLSDRDVKHVIAYSILNQDYRPGDQGYGIPHPGVLFINAIGRIELKFAYPGFRDRPSFEAIYDALSQRFAATTN